MWQTQYVSAVSINLGLGFVHRTHHGQRTLNEDINQRNLKIWADVADKICFGRI